MPSFGQLIANDFNEVMDDLEPITVNLVNRTNPENVSVPNACRFQMSRQLASYWNVSIEADLMQFSFAVNQFAPILSTNNIRFDTITDVDGRIYIVQSTQLSAVQTVWDVLVRRQTGTGNSTGAG